MRRYLGSPQRVYLCISTRSRLSTASARRQPWMVGGYREPPGASTTLLICRPIRRTHWDSLSGSDPTHVPIPMCHTSGNQTLQPSGIGEDFLYGFKAALTGRSRRRTGAGPPARRRRLCFAPASSVPAPGTARHADGSDSDGWHTFPARLHDASAGSLEDGDTIPAISVTARPGRRPTGWLQGPH